MKSLKSLFALFAIASLSFACASVTDAGLTEEDAQPETEQVAPSDAVFGTGLDSEPIIRKPKI